MIYDMLFNWQKKIIDKFKDRKSFALYLDMGLGKTPLSLAFAEVNKCTKIIIISINAKACEDENVSGSFFWWSKKSNIEYNLYNKKDEFNNDSKHSKTLSTKSNDILLINYESLFSRSKDKKQKIELKENIITFIKNAKNCNIAIIVDECHKLKDLQSLQTGAVKKIQQLCYMNSQNVYTYLLSGTPFTHSYIDLYSQLKILGWSGTKEEFKNRFCIMGELPSLMPYQQPVVGYKNINDLYRLIHNFGITIKSDEVIDLPEQIFVNHELPKSNQLNLYTLETMYAEDINKELKNRDLKERVEPGVKGGRVNNPFFRNIAYPSFDWIADTPSTFWMRARQLSIGFQGNVESSEWYDKSRLLELRKLLENNEDNYVLFYNYTPEFIELYELCEELGYKIDVYNGEIKSLYYYQEFEKLKPEEKIVDKKRIMLINFASGSAGMNLQEYDKCILFSIPVFKDYQQGIKRLHRIGQKHNVIYHFFYQNNWLDNSMLKALKEQKEYDANMFASDLKRVQEILDK